MRVTTTSFTDLLIIEPKAFEDNRGYFFESYNKKSFQAAGITMDFVQDNRSRSSKGVVRGLHFQRVPFAQTKLVTVVSGVIQDVVVDLRKDQTTFGQYYSIELSSDNKRQLLVPKGFAHGFLVLSESADVMYKCDEYYHPESEGGIRYNDPTLDIQWALPASSTIASNRDLASPVFSTEENYF